MNTDCCFKEGKEWKPEWGDMQAEYFSENMLISLEESLHIKSFKKKRTESKDSDPRIKPWLKNNYHAKT